VTNFNELGLAAPLLKALLSEGYKTPTPIQEQAIPTVLAGSDLLGIAQTGTGKTAAFALPILHRLAMNKLPAPRKGCRVLVLSPTRELASQIGESFKVYGRHLGLSVAVIFGGVPHRPQIKALARGLDILIATPGRLLDHIGERHANLSKTEYLVLDEADQMLDLGFVKPIRAIVSNLPPNRQTLFFSATMPKEITRLAQAFLKDPVKVAVTPVASTVERITQRVIHIEAQKKRALLSELLAAPDMSRTIVFTRTKRGADRVAKHLDAKGIRSSAIHGNKSQRQREVALEKFRRSKIEVLVATDIAARGIDINDVSHVVNFELPEVPEAYVHRIGRTARAGASGRAISLCDDSERNLLRGIERLIRQSIPKEDRRSDSALEAESGSSNARNGRVARGNGRGRSMNRKNDSDSDRHMSGPFGRRNKKHQAGQDERSSSEQNKKKASRYKRNSGSGSNAKPDNRKRYKKRVSQPASTA